MDTIIAFISAVDVVEAVSRELIFVLREATTPVVLLMTCFQGCFTFHWNIHKNFVIRYNSIFIFLFFFIFNRYFLLFMDFKINIIHFYTSF